jgi:hypothetical protein
MDILTFTPQQINNHRTHNALYGYRGQPAANPFALGSPEYIKIEKAYRAGRHRLTVRQSVVERAEAFVSGKKADRRCLTILAGCAAYILIVMVPQAIHYYLTMAIHP